MGAAFFAGYYLRHQDPLFSSGSLATRVAQVGGKRDTFTGFSGILSPVTPASSDILHTATAAVENVAPAEANELSVKRARRKFDTIYNLVRQYYVDKLPGNRQMSYSAIRTMLSSLNDPHCYFLEPEQYALLEAEAQGTYPGIGASLSIRPIKRDGYTEYKIVVISALPGSPAAQAGLRPGDIITHVNGRWVLGFNPYLSVNKLARKIQASEATDAEENQYRNELESARKKEAGGIGLLAAQLALRGDSLTRAKLKLPTDNQKLTISRPGVKEPLVVEMASRRTDVPKVAARKLPTGEGYLQIPVFTRKTGEEVRAALKSLPTDKGLVLDLRGNPGGTLEATLEVESLLLAETGGGIFAHQVVFNGKSVPLKARPASGKRRPVAILIDRGTASVAEALAVSLAEKGGAKTVGSRTFGDAILQAAYTLPDGAAFVIPTGKMLSPQKRLSWANSGVQPQIAVAPGTAEPKVLAQAAAALGGRPRVAVKQTGSGSE
ncbi:MAG: hypothetical protein OHK0029_23460 [Armatimonadaceae bacterium]